MSEVHSRIVFVHIPKTSGSAMNAILHAHSPFGMTHLEAFEQNPSGLDLRSADWVSGHMSPARLSPFVDHDERENIWFSVIRDPYKRLISQVNWALEMITRGPEQLGRHESVSLTFMLNVAGTDFTNPFSVVKMLLQSDSELSNIFTRYLLFGPTRSHKYIPSQDELEGNLARYAYIGWDDTREQLAAAFDFHAPMFNVEKRVNASRYCFDPAIFNDPIVKPYVDVLLAQDMRIYDLVRTIFRDAPPPTGSRPSYPLATDINFADDAYIAANPDVREAIETGLITSAKQHFDNYGRAEGRRLLSSIAPATGWREAMWPNPPAHLE